MMPRPKDEWGWGGGVPQGNYMDGLSEDMRRGLEIGVR